MSLQFYIGLIVSFCEGSCNVSDF